jgi:ribosomal protein L37E
MPNLLNTVPGNWYTTVQTGPKVKMTKSNSHIPCMVCGDISFLVDGTCSVICSQRGERHLRHNDSSTCQDNITICQNE